MVVSRVKGPGSREISHCQLKIFHSFVCESPPEERLSMVLVVRDDLRVVSYGLLEHLERLTHFGPFEKILLVLRHYLRAPGQGVQSPFVAAQLDVAHANLEVALHLDVEHFDLLFFVRRLFARFAAFADLPNLRLTQLEARLEHPD